MFDISNGVYYLFGPSFCMSSEGEFLFKNTSFCMIYNPHDDSKRFPGKSNYYHLEEAQLYIDSLVWKSL